ncbi:MAG TPA: M28 family peptidase [Solirubrobacteraceae bacterium]|nr:M28 family peptidase [Solirubrobacteraceae bacterium]
MSHPDAQQPEATKSEATLREAPRLEAVLREVVERLAPLDRTPCSPGERAAAQWLHERLRLLEGVAVQLEPEPSWGTFPPTATALGLAGVLAALLTLRGRPRLGALLSAATFAGILDEAHNGPRLLRRLIRRRRPTLNLIARLGHPHAPRTLVVIAHHDAPQTGLVFDQALQIKLHQLAPQLLERVKTPLPQWWFGLSGPLATFVGSLLAVLASLFETGGPRVPAREGSLFQMGGPRARARERNVFELGGPRVRACARANARLARLGARAGLLAGLLGTALVADIWRNDTVRGANDNLSGVSSLVALAELVSREPIPGLRLLLVSCGAEETLQDGIRAFISSHRHELDTASTVFVNLDTVASPHLVLLEAEGPVRMEPYHGPWLRDLLADRAAALHIPLHRGYRARASTDSVIPSRAGYPTATLASMADHRAPANYHLPTDVPANLHYPTLMDAVRLVHDVARTLASPGRSPHDPAQAIDPAQASDPAQAIDPSSRPASLSPSSSRASSIT